MTYREKATALFKEGYNCAQSVLLAFTDGDEKAFAEAAKISSSFGGGMGRLREVCGAVSGMCMVAGDRSGYSDPKDTEAKKAHYQLIQELAGEFKEQNGSIICRELLGLGTGADNPEPDKRTAEYYKKRPCAELVGDAAEIIAKKLGLE